MGGSDKEGSPGGEEGGEGGGGGKSRVKFEDILQMVGESGKWQTVIFLVTW